MKLIERELGRCLSVQQVAEYLQCDAEAVIQNAHAFGGLLIGTSLKFFERRVVNAILQQSAVKLDGASVLPEKGISEVVSLQGPSSSVGAEPPQGALRQGKATSSKEVKGSRLARGGSSVKDRHGLLV